LILEINLDNNKILRLVNGDITERNVDVIVNAANSYLKHGGGVAAAIVRKGGAIIREESDKIVVTRGLVLVGSAVITTAGKLPCKAVIHTVGPRMGEGNKDYKLRKAVRSSLKLASEKGFRTISMPAISSGIFGFPKDRCAKILEIHDYLFEHQKALDHSHLLEYAKKVGLDIERFKKDLAGHVYTSLIDESLKTGINSGVEGTPTFYINGVRYENSWDLETFSETIKRYLGGQI
jgi:O-acetyl-ADP-ribose deacetylase